MTPYWPPLERLCSAPIYCTTLRVELGVFLFSPLRKAYPYLVTSSGCCERFFITPAPPPDNPKHEAFFRRKNLYEFLFADGSYNPWNLMREFNSGKGPVIHIYGRRSDGKLRMP
ncbi:MAG: hypothetical protein ACYSR0_12480 [Planctomycetota bacterium]|jgi:hypothetical protein